MTDQEYMQLALQEGLKAAAEGDIPVGALVTDAEGTIIGVGRNLRRDGHDPTAHAEIVAIRQAAVHLKAWNLSGCTLYVTLEPCPMCAGAIVQARISRVVYGCTDPKAGACGTLYDICKDRRLFHRCRVTAGVLEEACRLALQEFFMECRRKKKSTGNPQKKS